MTSVLPQPTPHSDLIVALTYHYDGLVDYVRRRFGSRHFAQDVVQDVCVHLMERPDKVATKLPISLLRKISHDIAVDRCREQDARAAWVDTYPELAETACPAPDQFRCLAAKQALERLAHTIRDMPLRCQQVFVMHKIHELTQAEVALRLGISQKTVEKHLRLGMLACRNCLGLAETESHHAQHT